MIPHILLNGFLESTVDPQLYYTMVEGRVATLFSVSREFLYIAHHRGREVHLLHPRLQARHVHCTCCSGRFAYDIVAIQAISGTRRPTFEFRLAN